MTDVSELFRATPRQAREYVVDALEAGLVPFLISSPGMGKSQIIASIADEYGLHMIDHRLSTSAPEDLSGMPEFYNDSVGNRRARFVPFEMFPVERTPVPKGKNGWLLFLDEANAADKAVQAAGYKLTLDKMVGQLKLHEKCAIAMAGNYVTDRAIVNPLSTAMQSRVIHIEMQLSFNQWLEDVAIKRNYDPRIIGYLSYQEGELMTFKPDHTDNTFNCPRTWEFMNALMRSIETKDIDRKVGLFKGTISPGSAASFAQFCRVFGSLLTVKEILKDPSSATVPQDTETRWATISHLLDKVTDENFGDLSTYVNRFTLDFKILFFRSANLRHPQLRQHPAFAKSMIELAQYLND